MLKYQFYCILYVLSYHGTERMAYRSHNNGILISVRQSEVPARITLPHTKGINFPSLYATLAFKPS
jgi:hypothetical protein